ncbi:MAG: hypothetical protein KA074_03040 [Bacteroidales bacterium]|jgi:hypothetical protein|nr:hypothetical protein [Bacteroidales bacterium]HPH53990.1 hypothetical protein [Bacteroidales bacterium]
MKKLIVTALCCLMMAVSSDIFACTSAIISGRVTPDGRPLLWKHRDTGAAQNLVRYFHGDKYAFSAIAQTDNPNPKSVWMGVNEAGFAIMNTMSYNIEPTEKEENADNNGYIMKLALGNCADAAEFETLLNSLDKPWLIAANLGVIDAKGNAYYYEVNNDEFVRFDVNDPATAPLGYIVRSNFSFAGDTERGVGYVRYMHADEVVKAGVMHNAITPEFIFNELSRSFENPLIGVNLKSGDFNRPKTTGWFVEQDFIARYTTVSSVVIQGVKEGEPVELTTMWTVVSYPPTTVAMPVWVCGGEEGIPNILSQNEEGRSTLGNMGYMMKEKAYSHEIEKSRKTRYFNWELLWNPRGDGYMQLVQQIEKELFKEYNRAIETWRSEGALNHRQMKKLHDKWSTQIVEKYYEYFEMK